MKYLNNESQFTRISDEHARMMMESAGYELPYDEEEHLEEEEPLEESEDAFDIDLYRHENELFNLTEEVVEAEDGMLYVRVEELDNDTLLYVNENAEELVVEFVEFDDVDYVLEGLFEDEDGNLFACLSEVAMKEKEMKPSDQDDEDEKEKRMTKGKKYAEKRKAMSKSMDDK